MMIDNQGVDKTKSSSCYQIYYDNTTGVKKGLYKRFSWIFVQTKKTLLNYNVFLMINIILK